MAAEPDFELDWQAYRYLTADMSDADWRAFEAGLADDDDCQRALVEGVRLTAALLQRAPAGLVAADLADASAEQSPQPIARSVLRSRFATIAVTLLCLLALAGELRHLTGPREVITWEIAGSPWITAPLSQTESLLTLWAELDESVDEGDKSGEDTTIDEADRESTLRVPGWMLVALQAEQDDLKITPSDSRPGVLEDLETRDRL